MTDVDLAITYWTIYRDQTLTGPRHRLVATRDGRMHEVASETTLEALRARLPRGLSLISERGWGSDPAILETWA